MRAFLLQIACIGAFFIATTGALATPSVFSVSGNLSSSAGMPLTNASQAMRFKIYDASTSGNLLYDSGAVNVSVQAGHYLYSIDASVVQSSTALLSSAPYSESTQGTLASRLQSLTSGSPYLEITAGTETISPRIAAHGTVFAVNAADAVSGPVTSSGPIVFPGVSSPSVSSYGQGNLYFDSSSSRFAFSENGSAFMRPARRTTAALTLYVNPNGDDVKCNGTSSAVWSTGAQPNCAVKTPQGAIDLVPEIIQHPVVVNVAAGTYTSNTSTPVLEISKVLQRTTDQSDLPTLLIQGASAATTILSGPSGSAAGGIMVYGTHDITIKNFTVQNFGGAGVGIYQTVVTLDTLIITENSGIGLVCQNFSQCSLNNTVSINSNGQGVQANSSILGLNGTVNVNSNTGSGFILDNQTSLNMNGTLATNSNGGQGFVLYDGSSFYAGGSGSMSSNLNGSNGILLFKGCLMDFNSTGGLTLSGNSSDSLSVQRNSNFTLGAPSSLTISSVPASPSGIVCIDSSQCNLWATTTISGAGAKAIVADNKTFISTSANVSIGGTWSDKGIAAYRSSIINIGLSSTQTLSISRTSMGANQGVDVENDASLFFDGAGTVTISNWTTGILATRRSHISSLNGGTRTFSGNSNNGSITLGSQFERGNFSAVTCDASTTNGTYCY